MEINDIYPSRRFYYSNKLKCLEKDTNISDDNKAIIKQFGTFVLSTGKAKKYRVGKLISQLTILARNSPKCFSELDLQEVQDLLVFISSMDRSEATKADYRRCLKQFFNWFEDVDTILESDNYKIRSLRMKFYKFLKKNVSNSCKLPKIEPKEVITEEDLDIILEKGCETKQDKALISLIHETGMRTSEILLMKKDALSMDDRGIGEVTTGDGKTGSRTVTIVRSVPYLQEHIKNHSGASANMFYFVDRRSGKVKTCVQRMLWVRIKEIIERSGINKKSNTHWLRHSRASLDAMKGNMSESVRKRRMGWSSNSKMISNYTHLGKEEVKRAYLESIGIKQENTQEEGFVTCICGRTISAKLSYCPYCSRPMSMDVVLKERKRAETLQQEINDNLLNNMPTDPALRKEFVETINYAMSLLNNPKELKKFNKN